MPRGVGKKEERMFRHIKGSTQRSGRSGGRNEGFTDSNTHKFLDKDGFRTGIYHQYDGYTKRYVILSVYSRPLKAFRNKKTK